MSLIEVERKRKLADATGLKARLVETGYREASTNVEVDTSYSRPDRNFLTTVGWYAFRTATCSSSTNTPSTRMSCW